MVVSDGNNSVIRGSQGNFSNIRGEGQQKVKQSTIKTKSPNYLKAIWNGNQKNCQ